MENEQTASGTPEKSIREEIASAMETVQESAKSEPVENQSRNRDESGRFAKPAEEKPVTQEPQSATQAATQAAATTETPALEIPQAWRGEKHQGVWKSLSPDVQKLLADREAEVHKGFTRFDEERSYGKQLRDVINPYMPMIQATGSNPVAAVQNLLNTAYVLRTATPEQKVEALRQIAQNYGVPLDKFTQQVQQQPQIDPVVAQLQQEVASMRDATQRAAMQQQQQQQQEIASQIAAFSASPDHPHFEAVKTHMGALLSNGLANDLQDAYEQAVWARPDLRSSLLASQQAEAEAKRASEAAAKATAAKAAAASVKGNPAGSVQNTGAPDRSLRDELRASIRGMAA